MSAATLISFVAVLCLGLSFLDDFPLHTSSSDVGFSATLIHRDSPESPFHDPNSTIFSRNRAAIHRSAAHKNRQTNSLIPNSNFNNNISTIVIAGTEFDYIMLIAIGTPPTIIYALMDFRSNLMWMFCSPCKNCYKHKSRIFKPTDSFTYVVQECYSDECSMIEHIPCSGRRPVCKYSYNYKNHFYMDGILSAETLSFDIAPSTGRDKFQVQGIVFGCTHKVIGIFKHHAIGIVGISASHLSIIRQLGFHVGNKFSYCLPSTPNRATQIYFGSAAVVSSPNARSTPLYITGPPKSLYNIELNKIHVTNGTTTIKILPRSPSMPHEVRFVIDSGSAMTFISPEMMSDLSNALETYVPNRRVDVPEEEASLIDLCFDSKSTQLMPLVMFEFMGGAIVALKTSNIFILVNRKTTCLTISSSAHLNGESQFGSRAQLTTRMGYDLDARRLTFLPDDC